MSDSPLAADEAFEAAKTAAAAAFTRSAAAEDARSYAVVCSAAATQAATARARSLRSDTRLAHPRHWTAPRCGGVQSLWRTPAGLDGGDDTRRRVGAEWTRFYYTPRVPWRHPRDGERWDDRGAVAGGCAPVAVEDAQAELCAREISAGSSDGATAATTAAAAAVEPEQPDGPVGGYVAESVPSCCDAPDVPSASVVLTSATPPPASARLEDTSSASGVDARELTGCAPSQAQPAVPEAATTATATTTARARVRRCRAATQAATAEAAAGRDAGAGHHPPLLDAARRTWVLYTDTAVRHAAPFVTAPRAVGGAPFDALAGVPPPPPQPPLSEADRHRLARALQPDRVTYSPGAAGKPHWADRLTGGAGNGPTPFSRPLGDSALLAARAEEAGLALERRFWATAEAVAAADAAAAGGARWRGAGAATGDAAGTGHPAGVAAAE